MFTKTELKFKEYILNKEVGYFGTLENDFWNAKTPIEKRRILHIIEDWNCERNIILTPINLNSKSITNIIENYNYEKKKFYKGKPFWNDSKKKNSKIGDKFGFVHNKKDLVELFYIINILPDNKKRKHWRNEITRVIVLSNKICEITWNNLKKILHYKEGYVCSTTQKSRENIKY